MAHMRLRAELRSTGNTFSREATNEVGDPTDDCGPAEQIELSATATIAWGWGRLRQATMLRVGDRSFWARPGFFLIS